MSAITHALRKTQEKLPNITCRTDEPMKNHTSFKIGGTVTAMFLPKSKKELCELYSALQGLGIEPLIMGNGTNLLVEDKHLDIIVIKTTGLVSMSLTGAAQITAESGVLLSRLAVYACENGLSGIEFAHGIPGTLGGAVSMNAGAYGGEMKDVVIKTDVLVRDNKQYTAEGGEHGFEYRKSRFSDSGDVILSSVIQLFEGDKTEIRGKMEELAVRRRESQPLNLPSAGSTFKRPKDGYAASLIDSAGLKGYTVGAALVSDKHAGFVVNRGGASFDDVIAVVEHVQETVLQRFGITLEPEVKILRARQL